jgi:hypothetical protein
VNQDLVGCLFRNAQGNGRLGEAGVSLMMKSGRRRPKLMAMATLKVIAIGDRRSRDSSEPDRAVIGFGRWSGEVCSLAAGVALVTKRAALAA